MNIILWLGLIWLAPVMYFVLGNEAKFKKNIAVGVTFPFEGRRDAQVVKRLSRFKKELGAVCLALVLIAVPCFFLRDFTVSYSLWLVWVDLCIFLPCIPYVRCNRDLKRIKRERGWNLNSGQTVTVDTAAIQEGRWLSSWLFAPPVLLCLLPLIWERMFWLLYLTDALCVVLFWLCYRYLYRNRAELVDENIELTRALTQIRRCNWARLWLSSAYFMVLLNLLLSLTAERPGLMIVPILVFTLVFCFAALRIEFSTRRIQEKLTAGSGQRWYKDEDDLWIGGMFYYNPNDSRNMVNDRVGINTSFNMARPLGKICLSLVLVLLLVLPFSGLIMDGFTEKLGAKPLSLELSESELISARGGKESAIPLAEIEGVELREELPEKLIRTFGTGLENLLEGKFSSDELGAMNLRLDPNCPPFLLVRTTSGQIYLLGARDSEQIRSIFQQLSDSLDQKTGQA